MKYNKIYNILNIIYTIHIYIFRAYNPRYISLAVNKNKTEKYEKLKSQNL